MPHWEVDETSQREHVRLCFDLAERFDRDLDMHVDETDDGGVRTLEMVADEEGDGWSHPRRRKTDLPTSQRRKVA